MSIEDQIVADVNTIRTALEAEMWGVGVVTAGCAPDSDNLTFEKLQRVWSDARAGMDAARYGADRTAHYVQPIEVTIPVTLTPYGHDFFRPRVKIIEVEPGIKYRQACTHKRRRINKKWRKKYGFAQEPDYYLGDKILWDCRRDVFYCHPHIARKIEYEMLKRSHRL